jgi:diguanylate cyclase (GGDEF)-like protein
MKKPWNPETPNMGLEALEKDAQRYRRPWYWLLVLAAAALLATWLVIGNARSRSDQNDRQFASSQQLRLALMEQRVDNYFGAADQLVSVGAETLSGIRNDVPQASKLVTAMFRSRNDTRVYGVGSFYAPFAFDGHSQLFSIYDHLWDTFTDKNHDRFDRFRPGGLDEIVSSGDGSIAADDYTRLPWYKRATAARGDTVYEGPYQEDGRSFISTLKAFYRGRSLLGVMTVDSLTETFKQDLNAAVASGDIAWVESSHRGHWLLGTAPLPKDSSARIDSVIPLRYTGAYIHLSSDDSALSAANHRIFEDSLALIVAIWSIAAFLAVGLTQRWRARESTRALELERAHLESEIAIGKKIQVELHKAAYTDDLTGLPNRAAFLEEASSAIAQTGSVPTHAVFFIDLDRFNLINATLGHFTGDELLKMAGMRLRAALPPPASIARLGGDEFVVVMPMTPPDVGATAEHILACLREPMLLGGRITHSSASIGVVLVEPSYREPEELLRDVDIALHEAKASGRACYAIFDTKMRSQVTAESNLENDLRRAIERHEFVPYYQPVVETNSGAVISLEALVRWRRPAGDVVDAVEFVGYAERRGLIDAIDALVLEAVCRDSAALFARFPDASVAVNISAAHLTAPGLAAAVDGVLRAHSVSPARIKLEITETAIMTNAGQARATLELLQRNGIQIVLDDFGSGHSSLAYLHRLPIAGLKIDRSFITPLASDRQAVAIVRSIVALAKTLDLYTIAEGVETADQLAILKELGVRHAQGFLFSRALPLPELLRYHTESTAS